MGESGEGRKGGNAVSTVLLHTILKKAKETKTPVTALLLGKPWGVSVTVPPPFSSIVHHRKLLCASVITKAVIDTETQAQMSMAALKWATTHQ